MTPLCQLFEHLVIYLFIIIIIIIIIIISLL